MTVWTKLSVAAHFGGVAPDIPLFLTEMAAANPLPAAVHQGGLVAGLDLTLADDDPARVDEDSICYPTAIAPTGVELADVVQVANDHDPNSLGKQKADRKLLVDGKTVALIGAGLSYAGDVFSMSIPAQINANGVLNNAVAASFTYPYPYPTLANGYHDFADEAAVVAMTQAMEDRLETIITGGSEKKRDLEDAATQAALDAIVDDRV